MKINIENDITAELLLQGIKFHIIDRLCNIFDEMERDSDEYSRN